MPVGVGGPFIPSVVTLPVPGYRIGFAAQPLDDLATVAWTNITPYVMSHLNKDGAQHELSRIDAGTAQYRLNNRERLFDPTNTASPYYPNIRLGVPFQETQTWAGVTYVIFTGYIDDWDLQWPGIADAETVISCVDAFKFFNLQQLEASRWKIEVRKDVSANVAAGHNTAWLRLNESGGMVASDFSGMGFDGTYQGGPTLGLASIIPGDTDTALDVPSNNSDQRASLPYKNIITGFPFTVEFVFRVFQNRAENRMLLSAYNIPSFGASQQFQFFIAGNSFGADQGKIIGLIANPYPTGTQSLTTITVDDGLTHHCAIVMTASNSMRIWIDGVDVTSVYVTATVPFPTDLVTGYSIANVPAITQGNYGLHAGTGADINGNTITGGMQSFVVYDGLALSATRIQTHAAAAISGWGAESTGQRVDHVLTAIGWPSGQRSIEFGTSTVSNTVSGGTVLAYLQLLADTEGGRFFIANTGTAVFQGRLHQITASRGNTPQATFTDDGTGIPYLLPMDPHLDDLDWWTRASVSRVNGAPQIFDSIPGNNAPRTLTKSGLLMNSDAQARSMAQALVMLYKSPVTRIRSISFEPADSPTLGWPAALGLGIGDRITVKRHPVGGGPAWLQDSIIEGVTHSWPSGISKWRTTYALSPADPHTYFTVGTSVLGGSDVLYW